MSSQEEINEEINELQINLGLTFEEACFIFEDMKSLKKECVVDSESSKISEELEDSDEIEMEKILDLDERLKLRFEKALEEGRVIIIDD